MNTNDYDFDAWLDSELGNVPLPEGMLRRLREIPFADDAELDAAVRDVPVPFELQRRLELIGHRRARLLRLGQLAAATCLVAAIGVSYLGAMLAFLLTAYPAPGSPPPRLASQVMVDATEESEQEEGGLDIVQIAALAKPLPVERTDAPAPGRPEFRLAAYTRPPYSPLEQMREVFVGLYNPSGWDPLEDRTLVSWPVLAVPAPVDELPGLSRPGGLDHRGVTFPHVDGVEAAFLVRTGFNPFVSPAAHPELRSSTVPLVVDGRSYELTRQFVARGQRPPPDLLRTEDFLAAVDHYFAEPSGRPLAVYVAGGPSPFSPGDRRLVQIGVRARDVPDGDRPAAHLTLAVDVSASMGQGGRLGMVRRALKRFAGQMGPEDRVSLVAFGEDAYVLADDIGRNALGRFSAAVDSLAAHGSTNVVAGLRQAYAVAYRRLGAGRLSNRVVLITDPMAQLDPVAGTRLADRLALPTACGIGLHVIDVGRIGEPAQVDGMLAHITRGGGGNVYWATTSDQICWGLRGVATGKSQLVASHVSLKVTFNQKSVLAYRLLGHEVGDLPADAESYFYSGQSATALYEVQLRPNAEEPVAVAELAWRDPRSGQHGLVTRGLRRGELAASMIDAPLSVQAAAVAVEAVEVLRGSPFVRPRLKPGSLAPVLDRAREVDARLGDDPAFAELISIIEQAEASEPYRSGG